MEKLLVEHANLMAVGKMGHIKVVLLCGMDSDAEEGICRRVEFAIVMMNVLPVPQSALLLGFAITNHHPEAFFTVMLVSHLHFSRPHTIVL